MLRRIFGPKRDEVIGEWRELHSEEPNDLYPSPNIIQAIKSTRMRCTEHVARMEREEVHTGFWLVNLKERVPLEDPGFNGRIILK